MTVLDLNPLAIVAATVVHMALGYLWYGPLFGRAWATAIGRPMDQMGDPTRAMMVSIVSSLITAIAVAMLISAASAQNVVAGVTLALVAAVGFVATTQATTSAYESRNQTVTLLGIGYQAVGILLMGVIIGAWR